MNKCIAFFIFFYVALCPFVNAQPTTISGRVTDATTMDAIAFANVYFKGTTTGTTTDFNGFFSIVTEDATDSLTVSFVGYKASTKPVVKNEEQIINFRLQPSMVGLKEVVIVPGENPAITLMRKVWAQKDARNISNLESYSFENYTKTQVYLRRLFNRESPRDTLSERIFNRFSMAAGVDDIPAMPVYMSETFSKVYTHGFPMREKVVVKGTRTNSLADVETGMLTQLIQKNTQYNFNDNYVRILDKNFVSPLSPNGRFFYRYYLMDSLFIGDKYCYEVRIIPRRGEDLTFNGTFWINDTTYALKRISVEVGAQANLNFVERIRIQQDLVPDTSGAWYPHKTRIMADAINIFINAYISNNNFNSSDIYPLSFYDTELEVSDTAYHLSEKTWQTLRPSLHDSSDSLTLSYIDQLKSVRRVQWLTALVNMSIKGYLNLGRIELGPYFMLYNHNEVEGHRIRLGARTNSTFSQKWIASAYLAYGTQDEDFKYNAQLERFISRDSWTKAGLQYMHDVERLGAVDEFYSGSSFLSFATSFGGADKLNSIRLGRVWVETDLFRGFNQKIVFKNKHYKPLSPDYHFAYYDASRSDKTSEITVSELTLSSFYQPGATFIVDKNDRFPVAIRKTPAFTFNYSIGFKNFLDGDFNYHKASLGIRQNFLTGSVGTFSYVLNLSKSFTALPYPLLYILPANESFFRTERTFNLMRYGEFVADASAELFCTFRQEGFILDKFPLINRLGLRSVATLSMAYGSFDYSKSGIYHPDDNPKGILAAEFYDGIPATTFRTFDKQKPYIEVSYGIENILSVFRVDAIHRLTYLEGVDEAKKPKQFGLKFSAVFRF